ncbi:MAG TPA: RNA polymerase sigma factor SigJ [Acidimicrobiales bacterium]|nr:RNA polymerase sigma factor SigJ [Acidimicrobiales bacterium]
MALEFLEHRPRLLGIAYRMLGSMWDAEDVVEDAMIRWLAVDREQVREPAAFLTTMVTRRALDQLRSARVQRESYVGPWLPEPVATERSPLDPLDTLERRETLCVATLRLMEQLTPPERAVLVLHDAFGVPHAEIAEALDITADSSRQHLHRARSHLDESRPRFEPLTAAHDVLFDRFLRALEHGDLDQLQEVLAADAVAYSDGGGKARANRRPLVGADAVVGFLGALRRRLPIEVDRRVEVNGQPGVLFWFGRQYLLLTVHVRDGRIQEVQSILNPDKLGYLRRQLAGTSPG